MIQNNKIKELLWRLKDLYLEQSGKVPSKRLIRIDCVIHALEKILDDAEGVDCW